MTKKIAVGYDGSEGSKKALAESLRIAKLEHAEIHIVSIEEIPRYPGTVGEVIEEQDSKNSYYYKLHEEAITTAKKKGIPKEHIVSLIKIGHPARALLDYIKEGEIDLLVLGHSGHSGIWGSFLGSTTDKVTRHASCSVLITR